MNVVLDKFGRILIPKSVRRRLGLEPGTELRLEENETGIILRPVTEEPPLVEEDGLLVSTAALEEGASFDIVQLIRDQRRERIRAQSGID